jgi:CRP-like cAMP-binding protein
MAASVRDAGTRIAADPDDLSVMHRAITRLVEVPEHAWRDAAPRFSSRTFAAGEHLVRASEPMPAFFFVVSGLARYYYLTPDGKEVNKAFHVEREFIGNVPTAAADAPSRFFVQALETTRVVVLPRAALTELYDRHPAWDRLGRLQAERVAALKIAREAELLLDSAETRYRSFLRDRPDLSERLPQYQIASYLGITDVALSRIRRRMRQR